MFDEIVALPPRRVPYLGSNAVLTSDNVEAVGLCQAIKPVRDVKGPAGGTVDLVGSRPGAKEVSCGPRGDLASDRELDWPAVLVEVGKLLSHLSCQQTGHQVTLANIARLLRGEHRSQGCESMLYFGRLGEQDLCWTM